MHTPSSSTMYDADERRDEWLEEMYENQARYPLSSWPDESKSYWTNVVHIITLCSDLRVGSYALCSCVWMAVLF